MLACFARSFSGVFQNEARGGRIVPDKDAPDSAYLGPERGLLKRGCKAEATPRSPGRGKEGHQRRNFSRPSAGRSSAV